MLKITHYQRKPSIGMYSIERLFSDIRTAMPPDIEVAIRLSKFRSRGILPRIFNIIEAFFRQGDINHITGDVHFLAYLLCRRRTILTIHDCVSLEKLCGLKRWILWLLWYYVALNRVGTVTVVSNTTKYELLKYIKFAPDKINVIHCCVSDIFQPNLKAFNVSKPRILHVGTSANKNIERIAKALVGINCKWVVIGRLTEAQAAYIESQGIDYESYYSLNINEILEQYILADMLVFASTYEGFGLPIIEANAVGRPVVTSVLFSMPEVAGDAACLVDPYVIDSIRSGILRVIQDGNYRAELIKAGFANVNRFRIKVISKQYAELYHQIHLGSRIP